jgi:Flp pilus assembly protein TadD
MRWGVRFILRSVLLLQIGAPKQVASALPFVASGPEGQEQISVDAADAKASSSEVKLKQAKTLARNNQVDAAQRILEELVNSSPDLAEAHADLGLLLLRKRQFDNAAWQLGRAVQLAPQSAAYSMDLTEVLLQWHHYSTALSFLKAVGPRFGSLPLFKYDLAYSHYGLRQFDEAISIASDLVRQDPRYDLAYYLLGNCYVQLGNLGVAEANYRRALQLNSAKPAYYVALAETERASNKIDEALRTLGKARALDRRDTDVMLQLALCY